MTRIRWRWEEKDFGFRFKTGRGRTTAEHYQAAAVGEFYVIPARQRKFAKLRMEELAATARIPTAPKVVVNPWNNYDGNWDWIESADRISFNYAGCLHHEEIERREDEGVVRAREFVRSKLDRPEPAPITVALVRQIHREFMGEIYPFAGEWRTVALEKSGLLWPLPPIGIGPFMDSFEKDVLSRTPFISDDRGAVFFFVSEVMNELLAIHPFREGNGRTAFILADMILLQNNLLSLSEYDENRHQARYYAACEAGRVKDYEPLSRLIAEWEDAAFASWEQQNGE